MKKLKTVMIISFCLLLVAVFTFSMLGGKRKPCEVSSFAMGSPVKITVYDCRDGEKIASEAAEKINELDKKYLSHTLSSSYINALNSKREAETDEYFERYLKKCASLSADSEHFTLFCGGLKDLWKIEDGGYVPSESELETALQTVNDTNLNFQNGRVVLSGEGKLDLGALGKGTACGAAIDYLKANGVESAICTVGGTVGVIGNEKFTVGVRNPFGTQNEYFGTLNVTDCFISTSGDYEKYFEQNGTRYCHIFDAKTGRPVNNDITSVTVVASDGTVSDFLSTAIFCEGTENGATLAKKYNAEFIIVKKDKTVIVSDGLKDKFTLKDNNFTVIS